jgi:hypothetical protein
MRIAVPLCCFTLAALAGGRRLPAMSARRRRHAPSHGTSHWWTVKSTDFSSVDVICAAGLSARAVARRWRGLAASEGRRGGAASSTHARMRRRRVGPFPAADTLSAAEKCSNRSKQTVTLTYPAGTHVSCTYELAHERAVCVAGTAWLARRGLLSGQRQSLGVSQIARGGRQESAGRLQCVPHRTTALQS